MPILDVRQGHIPQLPTALPCSCQSNNSIRLAIIQRLQKNPVYDAENCCICADAERHYQHYEQRKTRTLACTAKGISKILRQVVDQIQSPHVAALLFPLFQVLKGSERCAACIFAAQAGCYTFLNL